jgi:hypothetical protein
MNNFSVFPTSPSRPVSAAAPVRFGASTPTYSLYAVTQATPEQGFFTRITRQVLNRVRPDSPSTQPSNVVFLHPQAALGGLTDAQTFNFWA